MKYYYLNWRDSALVAGIIIMHTAVHLDILFTHTQLTIMYKEAQQTEILKTHSKTGADELSPAVHFLIVQYISHKTAFVIK